MSGQITGSHITCGSPYLGRSSCFACLFNDGLTSVDDVKAWTQPVVVRHTSSVEGEGACRTVLKDVLDRLLVLGDALDASGLGIDGRDEPALGSCCVGNVEGG